MRQRKTDYGTIILHWLLVAAFCVSFLSGLRIATEAPGRNWINLFDAVLPRESVWVAHMQAAIVLVAVSLAYAVYVAKSGLGRRIQLDKIRLRGLFGRKQARLGSYNIVLYWIFFVTMLGLIASGGLLYFGFYAGHDVATLHWYGTWVIMAFAGLHVLSHYRLGGLSQLLRIFRPYRPHRAATAARCGRVADVAGRAIGAAGAGIRATARHAGRIGPARWRPRSDGRTEFSRAAAGSQATSRRLETARPDLSIQPFCRRCSRRHHRRFVHPGGGPDVRRPAADSSHQQRGRTRSRRRHLRSGLARHHTVFADDQRGGKFRRHGRNQNRDSRGA